MTQRGLRLAPGDLDLQFTHAMLLIDAERAGDPAKSDELLASLRVFASEVQVNVAVRMAKGQHPRFGEAVELVLGGALPERVLSEGVASAAGGAMIASFGDVTQELLRELSGAILARAPQYIGRLVPLLPDDAQLLSELAHLAIEAEQREAALALFDRIVALAVPDEGDARTNHLRALNNACVRAHAAGAYEAAVRIADRAQSVAHENPYIYHAAACAYAAVHDHAKALEQVKLAIEHDYEHIARIETDGDLGPLLEWPEFKTLFRDWHARREGN
jgi:tetratricopeptide (TPR) repeat protein